MNASLIVALPDVRVDIFLYPHHAQIRFYNEAKEIINELLIINEITLRTHLIHKIVYVNENCDQGINTLSLSVSFLV